MKTITNKIIEEVSEVLNESLEMNDFERLRMETESANRIFIAGEGRSGLVGKMIAMRLMHGGYEVYVTGETITPSISKGDIFFVLSGSGSTETLISMVKKAKSSGTFIACFTTDTLSPIAKESDQIIQVKAATKLRRKEEPSTIQPLGNQFDQSLHILLDAFIIFLTEKKHVEDSPNWRRRHTNLE